MDVFGQLKKGRQLLEIEKGGFESFLLFALLFLLNRKLSYLYSYNPGEEENGRGTEDWGLGGSESGERERERERKERAWKFWFLGVKRKPV
ncbi:hypothetical protein SAY86_026602 [Trapa natans]|uniref:Uncharacterized protein n=1 Tax=Trapa natans TaxID=22666 RepID=A0AAN7QEP9_TRANT|nr:hypothetical protein SAY86_026602 [Trapa natans]